MPIPDTKYNLSFSKLKRDICNNSFVSSYFCDSDIAVLSSNGDCQCVRSSLSSFVWPNDVAILYGYMPVPSPFTPFYISNADFYMVKSI